MENIVRRLRHSWADETPRERGLVVATAAAYVVALALVFIWGSRSAVPFLLLPGIMLGATHNLVVSKRLGATSWRPVLVVAAVGLMLLGAALKRRSKLA